MDIRRRMLFKKKASSSGGGGSTTGGSYTVNLNNQWQLSTSQSNPDSSLYDGVYESSSNYNVNSGVATMTITITGYKKFSLYIRSYAESNYDYVMVGQLNKSITGSTSYSSTDVKAHTRGNQQSGTAISNYTLVEFDNMIGGTYTITIVYRKDSSTHTGNDRGYVLISKDNEGYGDVGGGSSSSIKLGDIAYWDGSKVKTVSSGKWTTSLGTPVGVVVIPSGMLLDGKARIISLKYVNSDGTPADSKQSVKWGDGTDTTLPNYHRIPTTDNAGSTSTNSTSYGYLPSDNFTDTPSYVDSLAKYSTTSNFIPSPYLGDNSTLNSEYSMALSGYNNALSDFNGLSNTQTLVGLGSDYEAANVCWNYTGGVNGTGLQWYLPAMGELGFLMARFKAINTAITTAGGVAVASNFFWSSSEYSSIGAYSLDTGSGYMNNASKTASYVVRPFATIENNNGINIDNYLTIEALEDGLTANLSTNACEYCVDGDGNWKTLSAGTATESINSGQTLSFRGNLTPNSSDGIGRFTINKKYNLKGNCMSMLFGNNAINNYSLSGKNYAFYKLFQNCSNIINVSNNFLPATTLASSCYRAMFQGCYKLITAPELPATTLASECYNGMFYDCTSLTTAPELPATTLAEHCYAAMFLRCKKINYIKMLATDISARYCLNLWVNDVAGTGTFVKHPNMTTLSTGNSGIPSGWTVVNDGEESGGGV